jgi:quercetin dioxygenase-like cupin family protein
MRQFRLLVPVLLFAFSLPGPAFADESITYRKLLTPLLETGKTTIGQDIAYPTATPKVTGAIVVIGPGKETGWHTHAVPLFVYILQGQVSVDYGSKGVKVYKAGDSFLEAMNWPHNATNKTDKPVNILAVYIGAEGVVTAAPAAGPQ